MGNVEGKDIANGTMDIVVCDGFVGNVILKYTEGIGEMIFGELNKLSNPRMSLTSFSLRELRKRIDYAEYGGAPLLGINGVCIIGHGRSNSDAIKNAVRVASEFAAHKVNDHIEQRLNDQLTGETGNEN